MPIENIETKTAMHNTTHPRIPAANLRPLLGSRTIEGKTPNRQVWRSDNLMFSPAEEIQELKHQGLTTVIDLRSPVEIELESSSVLSTNGLSFLHRPLTRHPADPKTLSATLSRISTPEDVGKWYFKLALNRSETLATCLRDIVQSSGGVAFYCTAGKDRTGILAACFLLLLGASEGSIVDDYGRTNLNIDRVRTRRALSTESQLLTAGNHDPNHPLLRANPNNMRHFLRQVSNYGGIQALLAPQVSKPSGIDSDHSHPHPRDLEDKDPIETLRQDLLRAFTPDSDH